MVSVASLLAVLSDKEDALSEMWYSVQPNGDLLIIEPTELMNPENARKLINAGLPKKRINALRL